MFGYLRKFFSGNRVTARNINGNAIIGDVNGIVIQTRIVGPSPEPLSLPWRELAAGPEGLGIFNLLTWRSRLSQTLVGRKDDQTRLLSWARTDPRPIAIRLLTGPGGAGKSRLAAEVADELRRDGWSTGLVSLDKVTSLPLATAGLFIAIDYPEANREAVEQLLSAVGRLENSPVKIRLLLVSRQSMTWWRDDLIAARASELCDGQDIDVGPLAPDLVYVLVSEVVSRLATHLGTAVPVLDEAKIIEWQRRNPTLHGLPLFATAAAVHAILDPAPTFSLAGTEIIEALVAREQTRLDTAARRANWPETRAASRLHGLAALRTGLDERSLKHLAETAPDIGLPPPERIIDSVEALGWWIDGQMCAPQPDLIAAELLHQILKDRPQSAPDWLAATLADTPIEVDRLGRLSHDISILRGELPLSLVSCLSEAATRKPGFAIQWSNILTSSATTFRLAPLAIKIGRILLDTAKMSEHNRAITLSNMSARLNENGDNLLSLSAIEESVEIFRRLTKENREKYESDLATGLNNLASCLRGLNRKDQALAAIQEAVEIRRRLAKINKDVFEPDLARSLNNLCNSLTDFNETELALEAIKESVEIRRRLVRENSEKFELELARSLTGLSHCLRYAGDKALALEIIKESFRIFSRLSQSNPALFEPDLARVLNNLSNRLADLGQNEAASAAIQDSIKLLRRLAQANPARFEPDLAKSLRNLSNRLNKLGNKEAALTFARESFEMFSRLSEKNLGPFEIELKASQNNLSSLIDNTSQPK